LFSAFYLNFRLTNDCCKNYLHSFENILFQESIFYIFLIIFQEIATAAYGSGLRFSVNVSPGESESAVLQHLESALISALPNAPFEDLYQNNELIQDAGTSTSQHYVLPLPVGYLGRSIATGAAYMSPDHAALRVAGQLLSAQYLHNEVRERGGAYGSGATMSASGN
jgi:Zn-dependent M16 (insulinase) family peptidase